MFNKELSRKNKKAKIINVNFEKIGKYFLTSTLIVSLANFVSAAETSEIKETTVWEENMYKYHQRLFNDKNEYDEQITNLYHEGILKFSNKEINIKSLFLVYGKKDAVFKGYLVDTKQGFFDVLTGEDIVFDRIGAVRFCDTTCFINLINNDNIVQIMDNNIIVLDINGFQKILDSWDGYIHEEVKETKNSFTKQIYKRN